MRISAALRRIKFTAFISHPFAPKKNHLRRKKDGAPSGIGELGASLATGEFNIAKDGAAIMYGGASLGLPIAGNHPGLNGVGGLVQDGIVKSSASFGYNVLTGGAQLSAETLEGVASGVGLAKLGYDFLSYGYGLATCK
jgi:hypothetical protein